MSKLQVQWRDFESSFTTACKALRNENEFFDITLACEDDQVQAHKFILSAGSLFFKKIIKNNPHSHPLVYLKGVTLQNMKLILDFLYLGVIYIDQDMLKSFLETGSELGIIGLVDNVPDLESSVSNFSDSVEPAVNENGHSNNQEEYAELEQTLIREEDVKVEDTSINNSLEHSLKSSQRNQSNLYSSVVDVDIEEQIIGLISQEDKNKWKCVECQKYSKTKANLRKHVEIHIEGLQFVCKFCEKVFKTRNSLSLHLYTSKQCKEQNSQRKISLSQE